MTHPNNTTAPKQVKATSLFREDHEAVREPEKSTPETIMLPKVVTAAGNVNAVRTSSNVAAVGNPL